MAPDASAAPDFAGRAPDSAGTVVTVGSFDGVHRGHREILRRLCHAAQQARMPSVLITFEPHPLEVVKPAAAPLRLTLGDERLEVLAESGLDYMAVLPFTATLARYSPTQFVDEILRRRFHLRHLVIGYDHGFGRSRAGDVDVLRALGAERGFGVEVVPPVEGADGRPLSSTMVRRAVEQGDLAAAAAALGRPYSVSGVVSQGDRRGRLLGFPTINLGPPPPGKLLPPPGVYAVRTQTPRGVWDGMMNLGPRPTFGDHATLLEVHLFDADVDLYGARVRVDFVSRLRETMRFAGPDALVAQLHRDAEQARLALTEPRDTSNFEGSHRTSIPHP